MVLLFCFCAISRNQFRKIKAYSSDRVQDLFLRSTLDAVFKVGFVVELNSLSVSDEFGTRFTKAFDDSNFITYKRYVDLFWKAKRYLNPQLESCLKKNIKVIDDFIYKLIRYKEQMTTGRMNVSSARNTADIFNDLCTHLGTLFFLI